MESRQYCLVVLLVALAAMVATVESSKIQDAADWVLKYRQYGSHNRGANNVGDIIGEANEMLLDSESSRRQLAVGNRFISYTALQKNAVPCGRRGASYYNCGARRANPYRRGCTYITNCARRNY